jgi:hypothetical protein
LGGLFLCFINELHGKPEFFGALRRKLCCHANKSIARGIWHAYIRSVSLSNTKEPHMSATAAIALTPSATLLSRLLAAIDRWLLAYAEITIRNGDIPRCCV